LGALYEVMRETLDEAGRACSQGRGSVLSGRLAASACDTVVELLRAGGPPPPPSAALVVLAAPPGDGHILGLKVLAHLVETSGFRAVVVGDLPHAELLALAAGPDVLAVVLSVHNPLGVQELVALLESLREAVPGVRLAVGGPGTPGRPPASRVWPADLIGNDPMLLVEFLGRHRTSTLTPRESEMLLAVAEGLTTEQIAERLRVAPATVKSHMNSVFSKTGTEHRAAAVAFALRAGWIS
jgi:DNA-binding CsgD family transcriptional regulator